LRDARERAEEVLELIGMEHRRNTQAGLLTYAEQRALEIGITIAGGAEVILLDEPTAGMSRSESDHAVELIRKVTVGKTLVMVEHDMSVVFGLADRISVLVYGEVIATDPRRFATIARSRRPIWAPRWTNRPPRERTDEHADAGSHRAARLLRQEPYPARRGCACGPGRDRRAARPQWCGASTMAKAILGMVKAEARSSSG
jgi:energy-coupling factor transporter ATP-binding protein EcfA2